jgi:hypothetical protein
MQAVHIRNLLDAGLLFKREPLASCLIGPSFASNGSRRSGSQNAEEGGVTAERAAGLLLPNLPAHRPDAPGQFAFADQRRVDRILSGSGWAEIDIRPIDVARTLPEKELIKLPAPVRSRRSDPSRGARPYSVRAAFDPYVHGAEVRFTAACWMVSTRAPSASAAPKEVVGAVRSSPRHATPNEK